MYFYWNSEKGKAFNSFIVFSKMKRLTISTLFASFSWSIMIFLLPFIIKNNVFYRSFFFPFLDREDHTSLQYSFPCCSNQRFTINIFCSLPSIHLNKLGSLASVSFCPIFLQCIMFMAWSCWDTGPRKIN